MLAQPTSPFINYKQIDKMIDKVKGKNSILRKQFQKSRIIIIF